MNVSGHVGVRAVRKGAQEGIEVCEVVCVVYAREDARVECETVGRVCA